MDRSEALCQQVSEAVDAGTPLRIAGGDSKAFYGHPARGETISLAGHEGIVEYDPRELVLTCRAGSPLAGIRAALADEGQRLPFEPPAFGPTATVGGTVACGLSGPGRPWSGALRDYLLGVKLVDGNGKLARFGGQVMKNVAGYDVARLQAGAMGTLGLLLELSFKVLPSPPRELTLEYHCSQREAIERMNRWSGQPLPLSSACWHRDRLRVRLSGPASEVEAAAERMQAGSHGEDPAFWRALREHELPFFAGDQALWRLSLPPATEPLELDSECLVDWGGAQRWYRTDRPASEMRELAEAARGHASLFRGGRAERRFHPLPEGLQRMQERIRAAFDPHGIFNPGRLGPAD